MKRPRKSKVYYQLQKEIYYIKIPINKNDKYNPVIKCKGLNRFSRELMRIHRTYKNVTHPDSLLIVFPDDDEIPE